MAYWLKLAYASDKRESRSDLLSTRTVSDGPGRASPRWEQRPEPTSGTTHPPYGPKYRVGDRLVLYLTGAEVCPAIFEVTQEPLWDPSRVDREGKAGDSDKWGVVTAVSGIAAVDSDRAPTLEDIGVGADSVKQKGHIGLKEWQYREAERLLDAAPQTKATLGGQQPVVVPVEEGEAEGYDFTSSTALGRAHRRERGLVLAYARHLREQGDVVKSRIIPTPGGGRIRADLVNETRSHLVEAKAAGSRNDIRMAVGQLADYARFLPDLKRRAVLLTAKPIPDLIELLSHEGIAAVWRSGGGFRDDAKGEFT